jgi:predicted cation transporter
MSGGMFSWKLVSGLFQAMFAIGSAGTILPIGQTMKEFGFTHPLIQDLSEVVLSACASVLEMYAALHAKQCRYKDVRIVEYFSP